jgi:hypothetical protein
VDHNLCIAKQKIRGSKRNVNQRFYNVLHFDNKFYKFYDCSCYFGFWPRLLQFSSSLAAIDKFYRTILQLSLYWYQYI